MSIPWNVSLPGCDESILSCPHLVLVSICLRYSQDYTSWFRLAQSHWPVTLDRQQTLVSPQIDLRFLALDFLLQTVV